MASSKRVNKMKKNKRNFENVAVLIAGCRSMGGKFAMGVQKARKTIEALL